MQVRRQRAGDVFWFHHVDSLLPGGTVAEIDAVLREPSTAGGCFRIRFRSRRLVYRISDSLGNLGVDLFGIALGDHGILSSQCIRDCRGIPGGSDHGRCRALPIAPKSGPNAATPQ